MPSGWLKNVRKNNKNQKGKKKSKYVVSNKQPIFFRDCPDCSQQIGYKEERYFKTAEKKNSSCNSCTCKKYNIIQYLQTKESIQKMAATKAGFNSYKEYSDSIPAKKRYARDVWRVTRQQPIYTLENHNKRGRCGENGAYQLDHVVSIHEGFHNNISPKVIGHINNLQIIPWKTNLLKSK